ncbi:Ig-like domain-containing protein [Burkholderia sp. AU45388]|uniref:Ig-like domain-containing protein n=1 Tax=Burkholderia sp. AU45388 TaxID=3059206 RepID=UPI00265098C7|nr:Ig-like domain-containing protein [Burkholderia sp. AU45388]MDN7430403.1 Ig-like domain-containing protein [Burkholderia sp. AU45388]
MAEQKATTRPSRPTIDTVTDNVPPHTGVIEKGGLTNDPRPTVSGRGDPGATIHILVDGVQVGTAVVGANGTWSFALTQRLSDGEYRLTARASNEIGMSVPSASYGIQLDTTPPSQPKIDAATEGTQPMLSGQAEAYSTVTIYDGATVLGTVKTSIDGTWTFQLPSGLSNGSHALTVTAQDPAGNTSIRSAGFDVTIGPVAPPSPLAKALLDDMGRDSGNFNFDRLTNDGTAGRLLSGHLVGALAAGDKVQVSTDGGRTWIDALMKSDGTWVAIDPNTHTGNWTIQTRVVNAVGNAGEVESTDVALKMFVYPPTFVEFVDGAVMVKFVGAQLEAGSRLSVMVGDRFFMHTLTAAEIATGTAKFVLPNDASGMPAAAIVDTAGNISQYRQPATIEFGENFNAARSASLFKGESVSFAHFTLTGIEDLGHTYWSQGIYSGNGFKIDPTYGLSSPPSTMALGITGKVRLDLKDGAGATHFAFDVGDVTGGEYLVLTFRDGTGKVIYTSKPITTGEGILQHVEIDMPKGLAFTSIEFDQQWRTVPNGALTWIDNFQFSRPVPDQLIDPPAFLELAGDTAYYGGSGDTVFTVGDVSYFTRNSSGVHGGAGVDTLKLTGSGQTLDLATLMDVGGHCKISSIEIVDITGTGNNALKLSMRDVLELGHENVFRSDGHTQLMVKGDAGDRVELSGMKGLDAGQWTKHGLVAVDGLAFMLYENAAMNVELLVQAIVTTQLG